MNAASKPSKTLTTLAYLSLAIATMVIATLVIATLAGCGSSSTPKIAAASNIYFIEYTYDDTTDTVQCNVLAFPVTASGANATPSSTIVLPVNFDAYSIATGPTGKIYVGGTYYNESGNVSQILVYAAGATGSAQPITALTGNTPGTFYYPDFMVVNSAGQLFIMDDEYQIVGFNPEAQSGDLPQQYITTYITNHDFSYGIGADSAGNIYLANDRTDNIDVFAAGATGAATPIRSISNATSAFEDLYAITATPQGVVTVANYDINQDPFADVTHPRSLLQHKMLPQHLRQRLLQRAQRQAHANVHSNTLPSATTGLYTFAAGTTGAATPTAITGSSTGILEPGSLATDALGNLYYCDENGGYYSDQVPANLLVYPAGATGNVAPKASISNPDLTRNWVDVIAAF